MDCAKSGCDAFRLEANNVIVTSQADIDNLSGTPCFRQLLIRDASEKLEFKNVAGALSVVIESPSLPGLSFPNAVQIPDLDAGPAESLVELSMPCLMNHVGDAENRRMNFDLSRATNLEHVDFGNATYFTTFSAANSKELLFYNITTVGTLEAGIGVGFPDLQSASTFQLSSLHGELIYPDWFYSLQKVDNIILKDGNNLSFKREAPSEIHEVSKSLTIQSLRFSPPDATPASSPPVLNFGTLDRVGENIIVDSNSNVELDFSGILSIGRNITVTNNTACPFDFPLLGSVEDIVITDNVNTTLQPFVSLEFATNIHIRGYIASSYLFTALKYVSGSVTIEPWNDDFDCSVLKAQQQQYLINELKCRGVRTASPFNDRPGKSSSGLSSGAWAGIGVSIGLTALGIAVAAMWYFRRRHRRRAQEKSQGKPSESHPLVGVKPNPRALSDTDVSVVRPEAPEYATQAPETAVLPTENPDDHTRASTLPPYSAVDRGH